MKRRVNARAGNGTPRLLFRSLVTISAYINSIKGKKITERQDSNKKITLDYACI